MDCCPTLEFRLTNLPKLEFRFFYTESAEGVVGCCKLLGTGILCSCSCLQHPSGNDAPVNVLPKKLRGVGRNRFHRQPLLVGMGESFTAASSPGLKPVGGPGKGSETLQDRAPGPGPSSPPTGPRPGELEGSMEKAWIRLLPHSAPEDHHSTAHYSTNRPSAVFLSNGS